MKAPKKLKYPKKPKATASSEVQKNWLKRCDEIDKENRSRISGYEKEKREKESLRKRVAARKQPRK